MASSPLLIFFFSCGCSAALFLVLYAWSLFFPPSSSGSLPDAEEEKKKKKKRMAPIAGTVLHQLLHFSTYHDYLTVLHRKHKTFRLLGLGYDQIFTVDPANIEYILKSNFSNFRKGWYFKEPMEDFFGEGIFVVDGEKWRHQRKLASFEFSTKMLRDFSTEIFRQSAMKLAQIVSNSAESNQIIDIDAWFMKATGDSIYRIAFGVDFSCLRGTDTEGARFAKVFEESSVLITWRFFNPLWKISRYLNFKSELRLKENIKVVDEFVYGLMEKRMSQSSGNEGGTEERQDILSRFLLQRKEDPQHLTLKYLRDVVLSFLLAGKDSTSGTLSWLFCLLCKHPSIQEKIASEARKVTRSDEGTSLREFAKNMTEEAIGEMHYLHATLSETLRLYPAVSTDSKVCFSDDKLPDGISLKKGDVISYQPYAMGRMKFIWGDDAEDFRPQRWLDDDGIFQPESPFRFTAFQAGPRTCIGKEFAYRQMKVVAAVLLFFFRFELEDAQREIRYRTMLTLNIEGGLRVCASPRSKAFAAEEPGFR